jgi:hypothetical protein
VTGGSYKYSHIVKGRGRNIYGRPAFVEKDAMMMHRHNCPGVGGGVYYGERVSHNLFNRSAFVVIS